MCLVFFRTPRGVFSAPRPEARIRARLENAFQNLGNKDTFSFLTFTSPLPMITLANGSQTIAKGIGLACPLPSLPLTSVLYVHNFAFNLISINKLTCDLNCLITFFDNSVTL